MTQLAAPKIKPISSLAITPTPPCTSLDMDASTLILTILKIFKVLHHTLNLLFNCCICSFEYLHVAGSPKLPLIFCRFIS
ncbi:hypothetical protein AAHE18_14G081600 [Arachis hypogaea]